MINENNEQLAPKDEQDAILSRSVTFEINRENQEAASSDSSLSSGDFGNSSYDSEEIYMSDDSDEDEA